VWIGIPEECDSADVAIWWPSGVHQVIEAVAPGEMRAAQEPDWLRLSTRDLTAGSDEVATLTIEPRDETGGLLGSGHSVEVYIDGEEEEATDAGGGLYTIEIPTPTDPGEIRLDVLLDDVMQPAHPRLRVHPLDASDLRFYPAIPVEGAELQIFIDVGTGTAGLLLAGAVVETVEPLGDGLGTATIVVPETELTLRATRNGVAVGETLQIPANSPVDDSLSEVWLRHPLPGQVSVNAFLRDANGRPFDDVSAIRIMIGDTPHEESMSADRAGVFSADILVNEEDDGQRLHIEVAGQQIGNGFSVRAWADNDDVAAAIDDETSPSGPSQAGCYADGQDIIAIVALLLDADGHILPEVDDLQFDVTGAELIEEPSHSRGRYTAMLRCGTEPGVGRVELTYDDLPLGVVTEFLLRTPRTVVLSPGDTRLELTEGLIPPGEPAEGLIMPFDENKDAAGSVVTVELRPLDNSTSWMAEYCQVGSFCVEIPPPDGGGVVDVRVWLNGEATDVTGQVMFEPPHSEDSGDSADADAVADLDVADVGFDSASDSGDGISVDVEPSDVFTGLLADSSPDIADIQLDPDSDPQSRLDTSPDISRDLDTHDEESDEGSHSSDSDSSETEPDDVPAEVGDVDREVSVESDGKPPIVEEVPQSGCDCSVGDRSNPEPIASLALIILWFGARRRRRRSAETKVPCHYRHARLS